MSGETVIPFPPRFRPPPQDEAPQGEPQGWANATREEQADMVAHQLFCIARSLCFHDGALADDAIRRAAEIADRGGA